jgi:hypothetical protein
MRIGPDAAPRFLDGSALIVGAADRDGTPYATRGWGAAILDDGDALRVYVDADDTQLVPKLAPSARIAVTGGDVRTLASAQVKGRVRAVDELSALDIATRERATECFIRDVHETDHTPREMLERMVPARFVAVTLDVEELYDQTPGPKAGATLPAAT